MATGGKARQKGVEELEQEVTCPVCQDYFQEPKILLCLHYYCKGCIEALAKRAGGPNQPFPCPECRTPTLLPQGDPDQLQTAFFVNRMKEVHAKLEKVEGKVEAKCEMCSGGVATAFCRHCMDFICAECVKLHQRLKVFAGHEISTLAELKEGGARNIVTNPPPPPMCKVHEEQAKIYCYECKTLICRDCVIDEDHKGHEYEFVKKAVPKIQKNLKEHLTPLNESQKGIQNAIKNVEGAKAEVVAMDEAMITSIKQSFQELRDILDRREKELLAEIAATVEKKMNNLTVQQKKLEMSSGTIQSLVEFVERNIENATDEELMTFHTQMMTRISEEKEKQQVSNLELDPVEEADREVAIDCASELKKLCQHNTRMAVAPVNVAIENIDASVGEISKVEICLTYRNGQPGRKMQNIKVILTSKVDDSRVPTKIARKQENTYQIEFTPTVRGRHQLEVIYNDKPVLREPVQIFVKIPPTMLGKTVRRIEVGNAIQFIAFNSSEEMVVTTASSNEVLTLDRSGKKLRSFTNEQSTNSTGVAVDRSNIYITDANKNTLLKFDDAGKLLKSVGCEGSGEGEFNNPSGLTVVGDEVIVCDHCNHRLQVFTPDLLFVRQIGSQGRGNGQFLYPWDVTHDEDGNLYVTDSGSNHVQAFNSNGEFLRTVVGPDCIINPAGITYHQGLVHISQWKENSTLYVCRKNGEESCSIQCESSKGGVATDQDGFVYISNQDKKVVLVL